MLKINISNVLKMVVQEVIFQGKPLDKVLEHYFRSNPSVGFYEKEQLLSVITFTVRYWIPVHEIYKRLFSTRNIDFNEILHIQQILERTLHGKLTCKGAFETKVKEVFLGLSENKSMEYSYPEWLFTRMKDELGNDYPDLVSALNQKPRTTLRTNILKTDKVSLLSQLKQAGRLVTDIESLPDAILVNQYFEIFKSCEFHAGLFEMQDAGSQLIAPYLEPEAGMRVIDACSGNGGKTLHLSGLMKNKGKIIAMDIYAHKLEILKRRMKRAGAFNIETRAIDSSKIIKRLEKSADRLLLDVPCSGTGVLKRNPDIKYHLSPEKLQSISEIQQDILDRYSAMLADKGVMVYSTCSILPSENQLQIRRFLEKKQGSFELLDERLVSPLDGYDGFYMARLRRN